MIVLRITHFALKTIKPIRSAPLYAMLLTAVLSILLYGCMDDYLDFDRYKDLNLKPKVALPLGYTRFTMDELISKVDSVAQFVEDEKGTLILVYKDSLEDPDLLEDLDLGEFSITESISFDLSSPVFIPAGDTLTMDSLVYRMPYESNQDQRIDSMYIRSGLLDIEASSTLPGDIILTLIFPNIKNDAGQGFEKEIIIEGSLTGDVVRDQIDLNRTFIDLTTGELPGEISFMLKISFVSFGGILSSAEQINLDISSTIISLQSVFGFLGNQRYDFPDKTIFLDFFNTFNEGSINFSFPYLAIDMTSSVGIPMGLKIGTFYSELGTDEIVEITGTVLDSQVYLVPEDLLVNKSLPNGQIIVNPENSSFNEIFPRFPQEIIFDIEAELNPVEVRNVYNYLYDTSRIYTQYLLGMPLSLTMYNLEGSDTVNLEWDEVDTENIDRLAVKVRTDNGLPLGGNARVLFLGEDDQVIMDLFDGWEEIIVPAITDADGIPITSSADSLIIELNSAEIEDLFKSRKMIYQIIANTDQSEEDLLVSITRASFLDLSVGLEGDLDITVEFN